MTTTNAYCEATDIRMISHAVSGQANLYLLNAIEGTVDALVQTQRILEDALSSCSRQLNIFTGNECKQPVDPDEIAIRLLENTQKVLREFYDDLKLRLDSAQHDGESQGDHEESVVSEYKKTIELVDYLYDAITNLRLAVMEHDASLEETTGETFGSAADLMASIK